MGFNKINESRKPGWWSWDLSNYYNKTQTDDLLDLKQDLSEKWQAWWYASLDWGGKVPASQLPSYVDDVVEVATYANLPVTWESWKVYVVLSWAEANRQYRWSWSAYVEIKDSWETLWTLWALINNATSKVTPVDADMLGLMDSETSNIVKKLSWANLKASLQIFFDSIYQAVLVSWTNIKTINWNSVLWSWNLSVWLNTVNNETLSGNKTLVWWTDKPIQNLTTWASNRTVNITTWSEWQYFQIRNNNIASSTNYIIVQVSAVEVARLYSWTYIELWYNWTSWMTNWISSTTSGAWGSRIMVWNMNQVSNTNWIALWLGNIVSWNNWVSIWWGNAGGVNSQVLFWSNNSASWSSWAVIGIANTQSWNGANVFWDNNTVSWQNDLALWRSNHTNLKYWSIAYWYYSRAENAWDSVRHIETGSTFPNIAKVVDNGYYRALTNNTQTEIFLFSVNNERYVIPARTICNFKLYCAMILDTSHIAKAYEISWSIKRDNSNNTSIVWTITKTTISSDTWTESWDIIVTADDTNEALKIEAIGNATWNTRVACRLETIETKF